MYNKYYEKYPPESVVYFVEGNIPDGYDVNFGIVKEYYSDRILLQIVHLKDTRLVDGIPYNKVLNWGEWKKVPKDWEYTDRLFEITYSTDLNKYLENLDITNPKSILEAYRLGILIDNKDYDFSHIEVDFEKDGKYRLVKKFYNYERTPSNTRFLEYHKIYKTYSEAQSEADNIMAEFNRQVNLSDYDWSLEQIDKKIDSFISIEESQKYKDFIRNNFTQKEIENMDIRVSMMKLQIKKKGQKWHDLVLD